MTEGERSTDWTKWLLAVIIAMCSVFYFDLRAWLKSTDTSLVLLSQRVASMEGGQGVQWPEVKDRLSRIEYRLERLETK